MKLVCHPYRYLTEPIRILSHWKQLELHETVDNSTFPLVPSLHISDKKTTGLWEIVDTLLKPIEESKHDPSFENYTKARSAAGNVLKTIEKVQEGMISASGIEEIVKSESLVGLIGNIVKEVSEIHKQKKFFHSDEVTPIDFYFYDFYRVLDMIHPKLISPEIAKYLERIEAQKWMRTYLAKEANYKRDFTPAIPSFTNRILGVVEDKIPQLCDFAMLEGILYKTKLNTVDNGEIFVPTHTPLSLYPKRVSLIANDGF